MPHTILAEGQRISVPSGRAEGADLWIPTASLEAATGWALKPEGACQGEVCVPLPRGREAEFASVDAFNYTSFMRYMGHPVAHRDNAWSIAARPEDRNDRMRSLEAPDFTLPDIDGNLHSLSDYRGKKVFLASWASW